MSRRTELASLLGVSLVLAALLGTGSSPTIAQEACAAASPTPSAGPDEPLSMPEEYRIALFDGVWNAIDANYVYPDFHGVDWAAVREEYEPYLLQTENAWQVYDLLREMVALLEDPYTQFLDPLTLEADTGDPTYGGIGGLLDSSSATTAGEGPRILYVFPGSAAEEAGLRARDRILAVNNDPCVRIRDIRGPVGTQVTLTIQSPGEEPRDVVVDRRRIEPVVLPDTRRLQGSEGIGYLRLAGLEIGRTVEETRTALAGLLEGEPPLEGLILDLRGTSLGNPAAVLEILGHFVEGLVGALYARSESSPLGIEPSELRAALADVPLVVLLDEGSEGEAEQVAAILQDRGRALVVGKATEGRTHAVQVVDFPDGSALQLAVVGFELPDGTRVEEAGVTPDIAVAEDWLAFPEADDPMIARAVEALVSGAAEPRFSPLPMPSLQPSPEPAGEASPATAPEPDTSPGPAAAPEPDASAGPSTSPPPPSTPAASPSAEPAG